MGGKIFLVGIGPGDLKHITPKAMEAFDKADLIVGYETYLSLIKDFLKDKETISSKMTQEVDRVRKAVEIANDGGKVALISGGDPGIYGMASVLFQYLKERSLAVDVEVIPGITAGNAASSLLGSPLGHDFAVISLSDLLTPWRVIEKRLRHASKGDFCLVLYNPKSKKRTQQFERAIDILMEYKDAKTPVGIVRNATREGEEVKITTLKEISKHKIDMLTTVVVGNSESFVHEGRIITPRGYERKYRLRE